MTNLKIQYTFSLVFYFKYFIAPTWNTCFWSLFASPVDRVQLRLLHTEADVILDLPRNYEYPRASHRMFAHKYTSIILSWIYEIRVLRCKSKSIWVARGPKFDSRPRRRIPGYTPIDIEANSIRDSGKYFLKISRWIVIDLQPRGAVASGSQNGRFIRWDSFTDTFYNIQ